MLRTVHLEQLQTNLRIAANLDREQLEDTNLEDTNLEDTNLDDTDIEQQPLSPRDLIALTAKTSLNE